MSNNINPQLLQILSKMDKDKLDQLKGSLSSLLAGSDMNLLKKQVQSIDQAKLANLLANNSPDKINQVLVAAKTKKLDLAQIISQLENLK